MWNPLSWAMEAAVLVTIALSNVFAKDFVGIVLLFINSTIGFYDKRGAGNTVKVLMDSLAPKESSSLQLIFIAHLLTLGLLQDDCHLTEVINNSIDQAAPGGESLPQSKKLHDQCFSCSTCKQGEAGGVVISTGATMFFGRVASLVGQIGSFCLVAIGIFIIAEILVLYAEFGYSYRCGIDDILVILIGSIPIAMPTVLSVPLAVGTQQLAKAQGRRHAYHRRRGARGCHDSKNNMVASGKVVQL
ncbi:Plasma membrane ATPase [Mycena venus]|uniref:Plasma membrane ATPase n=1 Tax=Mycena venus TaxID=2733690 RepID=A0A8H6U272_9AGAR|nr:Plasma membrane ATPase [Mycena venus]